MSRTTRKLLLLVWIAGVLPLAVASIANAGPACSECGIATYDFNGDGKSDLLGEKDSGSSTNPGLLRITRLDGADNAPIGSTFSNAADGGAWTPLGAGHFTNIEGSGGPQADLLLRQITGPNPGLLKIVSVNPTTGETDASVFPCIVSLEYSLLGIGDLNDDGTDDLVFVKISGGNSGLIRVYLFNNDGSLLVGANFPGVFPDVYDPVGVLDMDGDGIADLVGIQGIGGTNPGLYRVFIMAASGSGASTVISVSSNTFPGVLPSNYDLVGLAYNNADDRGDFVMIQNSGGSNPGLVRAQRTGSGALGIDSSAFPVSFPTALEVDGLGNYDGLNQGDVLGRNTTTGQLRISTLVSTGTAPIANGFPAKFPTAFDVVENSADAP